MSIEARQIQKTLYSYAAILNFTPSPQGLRAKFGACSVQNAQLLCVFIKTGVAVLIQSIYCKNSRVSLCFVNAKLPPYYCISKY